jgi:hypothetical protein
LENEEASPGLCNFLATINDDATKHSPLHVKEIDLLGSLISGLFLHPRQIPGADENSPVRFCAAGKIFATGFLLDGRPVSFEYRQLVLAVSPKWSSRASLLSFFAVFIRSSCASYPDS